MRGLFGLFTHKFPPYPTSTVIIPWNNLLSQLSRKASVRKRKPKNPKETDKFETRAPADLFLGKGSLLPYPSP